MPNETTDNPGLPSGIFEGRTAFRDRLHAALAAAAREGWREIVLSDPDFLDWPLGERAIADALQAWSRSGRQFMLLAQRFDVFERDHARFAHWRRMWGHIVECRACEGPGAPAVPSAIWTPTWFLRRIDTVHSRGSCGTQADSRRALREAIDECVRHSKPAFAASTLGL